MEQLQISSKATLKLWKSGRKGGISTDENTRFLTIPSYRAVAQTYPLLSTGCASATLIISDKIQRYFF